MNTRTRCLWALLPSFLWGCRNDLTPYPDRAGPAEVAVDTPADAAVRPVTSADFDAGSPQADAADAGTVAEACSGPRAAVAELTAGLIAPGSVLSLQGVVATSQKFLVSSGQKCWYGAFASDADAAEAPAGILMVAAAPRLDDESNPCPGGRDALPDDLAAGDVIDAVGSLAEFLPSSCGDVAPELELIVHDGCSLQRVARGMTPPIRSIDAALATDLARGSDATLLRAFGGALVRLENVTALRDGDNADVVGPYGVIRLSESPLEVHDKIFYFDFSGAGPATAGKGPKFGYPTEFSAITGLVYLDFCTWSLAPRNKCTDFDPPSEDCPPPSAP